jgi:hypothetical protein
MNKCEKCGITYDTLEESENCYETHEEEISKIEDEACRIVKNKSIVLELRKRCPYPHNPNGNLKSNTYLYKYLGYERALYELEKMMGEKE